MLVYFSTLCLTFHPNSKTRVYFYLYIQIYCIRQSYALNVSASPAVSMWHSSQAWSFFMFCYSCLFWFCSGLVIGLLLTVFTCSVFDSWLFCLHLSSVCHTLTQILNDGYLVVINLMSFDSCLFIGHTFLDMLWVTLLICVLLWTQSCLHRSATLGSRLSLMHVI